MGERERTVTCGACGHGNPAEHTVCFICSHALGSPVVVPTGVVAAPRPDRREAFVASLGDEQGVVRLLRVLYLLYAGGYLLLSLQALIAGEVADVPGSWRLLLTLQPVLCLALVLVALRRLEEAPFTWALVMAGMETLALFQEVQQGTWRSPHTIAALLLWTAVFACARTAGLRAAWAEGRTDAEPGSRGARLAGSLLVLYAGVFVALLLVAQNAEGETSLAIFHGCLVGLGLVAAAIAGDGTLKDSARFRVIPAHLLPTVAALLVVVGLDAFWIAWKHGRWIPEVPHLAWPSTDLLLWMAVAPGVFEEWLCRGVMWSILRRHVGLGGTVLATATLFALMHGLTRGGLSTVIPQLLAGVVFGLLRARTGSLVPCMVVHALGNLYVAAWLTGRIEELVGLVGS